MRRYEGLFILDPSSKEDGNKETIDKITAEITQAGGKVETVQKMDKRPFSRVARKAYSAGFYVNIIFEGAPTILTQLRNRFALDNEVFRVVFTQSPALKTETK